jgi:hypothetical protein
MEPHFSISDPEGMKAQDRGYLDVRVGAQGLSLSHE